MKRMIQIRLAQASDAPELKKLNDLFNEDGYNTIKAIEESSNSEGCSTVEMIEKSLKKNKQEIVCVAAEGDKLVGFCCGQFQSSMCYSYDYAVITESYVIGEYRSQGIGRQLLTLTETEFSKRGVTHFHVSTNNDNKAALQLLHSCGYVDTSIMLEKDHQWKVTH